MKKSAAALKDDNLVQGVDVSKVKVRLVTEALRALDVDIGDMSASDKVEALQFNNRKLEDKATCTNCGGVGPSDMVCPFCGDEGEDDEEEAARPRSTIPPPKAGKLAKVVTANNLRPTENEFSAAALDEANKRILEIKERGKQDYWELGSELLSVYASGLWKARTRGGKIAYTSYNQYVQQELGISHTTAFNMMDAAKNFTREQVKQLGGAKLVMTLGLPKSAQDSVIEEIEKGATRRQIKETVEKAKKKHKIGKRETGRKKMPKGKPGAKRAKDGRITVAAVEGSKTYELWAKPAKALKEGEKPTKRATSVKDEPWCQIKLQNGVEQIISVAATKAGLVVKIVTRRR